MNLDALRQKVKDHPDYSKVGMVLCHNGVVRATARDGRPVSAISIKVDWETLKNVIETHKAYEGIVDIQVELADEHRRLNIGEDVMYIVVAGDIRENVINCLSDTLNAIKETVTSKTEYFLEGGRT